MAKTAKRARSAAPMSRASRIIPIRNVVPDALDLRDRPYMPTLLAPPPEELVPDLKLPVLNQGRTNACTGFALATVAHYLLRRHRDPAAPAMSPFMLYSMARRYDEFPDPPRAAAESETRQGE